MKENNFWADALLSMGVCVGVSLIFSGLGSIRANSVAKKFIEDNGDDIIKDALNHEQRCIRRAKILEFENQELRNLLYSGKH